MRKKHFLLASAVILLFMPFGAFAADIPALPEFTKEDRVLILAPHPDDETLGSGGVIQRARDAGARVQVVCYTNGDHNELAFIVYEKRFTFRTGEFLYMGEVRRSETIKAMSSLGLPAQDMIFLGYPDFGTMAILTLYWNSAKSYRSLMTRISKVAYSDTLSPGAPYIGESILKDLKTTINNFQPTKIFVSHPADTNRDHQSLYLFTRIALWELEGKIIQPEIYPYLIHVIGWPKPRGHHLDLLLKPPAQLGGISWKQLILTDKEAKVKQGLVDFYKSEIECNPPYLYSYARKNEIFGDFPAINLKDNSAGSLAWQSVVVYQEPPEDRSLKGKGKQNLTGLFYAIRGKDLMIKLDLRRKLDKNLGITINLLGYKKNSDFAAMPKISVTIGLLGMRIRNKAGIAAANGAKLKFEGRSLIVNLPLATLGEPEKILTRVKTRAPNFPLEASAWRILTIK
ncbi:MAG: PIG-L family deacetylase [Candidatus Omnitrophica bacterium]|nr:PIG-L family deacetylase [Candidatus Omnitrophota bacterium]